MGQAEVQRLTPRHRARPGGRLLGAGREREAGALVELILVGRVVLQSDVGGVLGLPNPDERHEPGIAQRGLQRAGDAEPRQRALGAVDAQAQRGADLVGEHPRHPDAHVVGQRAVGAVGHPVVGAAELHGHRVGLGQPVRIAHPHAGGAEIDGARHLLPVARLRGRHLKAGARALAQGPRPTAGQRGRPALATAHGDVGVLNHVVEVLRVLCGGAEAVEIVRVRLDQRDLTVDAVARPAAPLPQGAEGGVQPGRRVLELARGVQGVGDRERVHGAG